MTRPAILIIENAVDITGGLISVLRSSRALRDQYQFTFLLPAGSRAKIMVTDAGFQAYELPLAELRKNFFSILAYIPLLLVNVIRLKSILRVANPSLIVVNDFYNLIPGAYRMLGGKIPYVCFIRFVPSRFPGMLVKLWMSINLRYAVKIIAVSDTVVRDCPRNDKIVQIYDPLPEKNTPYHPSGGTTILCLANFTRGKGQEFVLEAFSQIRNEYPFWKLRFVGSDMGLQKNRKFREELKARAQLLGIEAQTEWLPATNTPDAEYAAAAFTVNFSESESFSLTCLESLYAGRTVVATRSGGPAEIVDDQVSGILVPVGGVDEMAKAMRILISDTGRREMMSRTGYERVRQKFSNAGTVERLSAVYLTGIQENKGLQ